MKREAFIVYCSPAGTTRHVGEVIAGHLETLDMEVTQVDLGLRGDHSDILARIGEKGENCALFIGSPVYVSHALPQVMKFIDRLPESTGGSAVSDLSQIPPMLKARARELSERPFTRIFL